jgi:hypothetical protein
MTKRFFHVLALSNSSSTVSVAFRRLRGQVGIRVFVSRTCGWKVSYGDTPKSSRPLDNFHSETNGDLGILHFKAAPKFKRA